MPVSTLFDPILKEMLPNYFFYHHSESTITVYPEGDGGYLTGNNPYTYLYCIK